MKTREPIDDERGGRLFTGCGEIVRVAMPRSGMADARIDRCCIGEQPDERLQRIERCVAELAQPA